MPSRPTQRTGGRALGARVGRTTPAFVAVVRTDEQSDVLDGLAFGLLCPDRTDYVGHFLAGAGGTFLLLAVVVTALPGRPWAVARAVRSTVGRSTIPWHLDGTVTQMDVRPEKHPGVDDAWYVTVDAEARRWDAAVAQRLEVGDRVAKDRWDHTIEVDQSTIDLTSSRDAKGMALLGPLLLGTATALALMRGRTPPRRDQRPPRDHGARL